MQRSRSDIGGTTVYGNMNTLTQKYDALLIKAERQHRNVNGPSQEEVEYYVQASDICCEIVSKFQNISGIKGKWETNQEYCRNRANALLDQLGAAPAKSEKQPEKQSAPAPAVPPTVPQNTQPANTASKKTNTADNFTTNNANEAVSAEKIKHWYQKKPEKTLDELVGMDDIVQTLKDIAETLGFVKTGELLGISPEKGILLYGFHGNGKTTIIEAFVNYLMSQDENVKYLKLTGGDDIKAKYVGEAEKIVQAAFNEAIDCSRKAPCILFFDEIDNVFKDRGSNTASNSTASLTAAFLEAYNTLVNAKTQVIVFGATNNPWDVDSAVISRLAAAKIYVPLPSEENRKLFFEQQLKNVQLDAALSAEQMAADTDNFDYRDLKGLIGQMNSKVFIEILNKQKQDSPDFAKLMKTEQDAVASEAVKSGAGMITKEMYDAARAGVHPSLTQEERVKMDAYVNSLAQT